MLQLLLFVDADVVVYGAANVVFDAAAAANVDVSAVAAHVW